MASRNIEIAPTFGGVAVLSEAVTVALRFEMGGWRQCPDGSLNRLPRFRADRWCLGSGA